MTFKIRIVLLSTLDSKITDMPKKIYGPKRPGLLGGVLFGEMKFVLSNFLSSEDLSI
jgi:hypothetical protein